MGVQLGVNLTGATVSSQSHELKTSGIADHDAMTNPPPMGGGSENWGTRVPQYEGYQTRVQHHTAS